MPSTRVHVLQLEPLQHLLHGLSRDQYVQAVPLVGSASIGAHARHLLDHYHCLLEGAACGMVDYQARRRGSSLERDAAAARAEIAALPERLARLGHTPRRLLVRVESEQAAVWASSTVARELDYVLSHTIHHLTIIGTLCRALHIEVDGDFGVAPSTLRARAAAVPGGH